MDGTISRRPNSASRPAHVVHFTSAFYMALTACMRKLLIILNSMLKYGSSWNHPATRSLTHSY